MENPLIIGLTCGAAFLLAFLLVNPPGRSNVLANRWLALFAATFGCAMLEIFLHTLKVGSNYRVILDLTEVSRFISAPALYLCITYFVRHDRQFRSSDLLHFLPFACFFIFLLPHILTGRNFEFKSPTAATIAFAIIRLTLPIQTVAYWLLSYRKLKRHQRTIYQIVSSTEPVDLSWLEKFLWVLAFVIVLWLNLAFFELPVIENYTPYWYLIATYFLAYFALRQQEVFPFPDEARREIRLLTNEPSRPARQKRVDDALLPVLQNKLEQLMITQKLYLDCELSLPSLAGKLDVTVHELSYLINEVYQENFFSFVNRYRIDEARRLLLSDKFEKLNILGVAYESGFNSKTTFNTTFKKLTGQSPTAFRTSRLTEGTK